MSKEGSHGECRKQGQNQAEREALCAAEFSVPPEIAAEFRAACSAAGVSMASAFAGLAAEYAKSARQAGTPAADCLSTKAKRLKAVKEIVGRLGQIRDAQESAMENMPENFRDGAAYESAAEIVEAVDEAIGMLQGIY